MKKSFYFVSFFFSFLGLVTSFFQDIISDIERLPIEPTIFDLLELTPSFRALPYSILGFMLGSIVFLLFFVLKKVFLFSKDK